MCFMFVLIFALSMVLFVVMFVLSVMRVVGGVPLWVECVFRRVGVVCFCLLYFFSCSTSTSSIPATLLFFKAAIIIFKCFKM